MLARSCLVLLLLFLSSAVSAQPTCTTSDPEIQKRIDLVEQGRLGLDEDIHPRLTSWKVPAISFWQPWITLRQLLTHSAGLTVHGFPGYGADEPVPIDALVGEYETASKLRVTVARQGESLLLMVGNQPPLALAPQSDTSFLLTPLNGKVTFEKGAEGRGRRLTLEHGGVPPTTAERVGSQALD